MTLGLLGASCWSQTRSMKLPTKLPESKSTRDVSSVCVHDKCRRKIVRLHHASISHPSAPATAFRPSQRRWRSTLSSLRSEVSAAAMPGLQYFGRDSKRIASETIFISVYSSHARRLPHDLKHSATPAFTSSHLFPSNSALSCIEREISRATLRTAS